MTHRIFAMAFADLYPLYLIKVEKKGKTEAELRQVLTWLTGLDDAGLEQAVADGISLEEFFERAHLNANAHLITGVICGKRVEEIEDRLMQKIRYMDKLVDELARGKKMTSILRS